MAEARPVLSSPPPPHPTSHSSPGLVFPRALLLIVVLAGAAGCRANCDLVEAELRHKEEKIEELKQELEKKDCEIENLEAELEVNLRRAYKPGAEPPSSPYAVKSIVLSRLTGGTNQKPDCPFDDALQVVLEPRDCDDQSIKAPGSLHVDLYEIEKQGQKTLLSSWDVSPRELRRRWENQVFGNPAYRVILPWKTWPGTERLRVVAHFTTLDGRKFEADKDITVRLPDRPNRVHSPHAPEPLHMPKPLSQGEGPILDGLPPPTPPQPPIESAPAKPPESKPEPASLERPAAAPAAEVNPAVYRPITAPAAPTIDPVVYRVNAVPAAPVPQPQRSIGLKPPPGARQKRPLP